ncbi:MAG: PKD domain-containing protein [Thermodesulfobacteriota bacterium]
MARHIFRLAAGILFSLILLLPDAAQALPGDFDHSGRVDGYDLILFARARGATSADTNWLAPADFDASGVIDDADLAILSSHFGRTGAAFGVWPAVYDAAYKLARLGADGSVLGLSPALTSAATAVAGNIHDGTVWVVQSSRIVHLNATGSTVLHTITGVSPKGIAVNPADHSVWVTEQSKNRLLRFTAGLPAAYDLTVDTGHHQVFSGFSSPTFLDVDSRSNTVWIANSGPGQIIRLRGDAPSGYDIATASGYHRAATGFSSVTAIRANQSDSSVWILSSAQVSKLDATGRTVLFQMSGLSSANGLDVNFLDGSAMVIEQYGRIRRFAADGSLIYNHPGFYFSPDYRNNIGVAVNPFDGSAWVVTNRNIVELAGNGTVLQQTAPFTTWQGPVVLIPAGGDPQRLPTAIASASKENLAKNETVQFTGIGTDSDGTITTYQWDFDGDGVFDFSSADSGIASHSYGTTGIYTPVFMVTDNDHLTASDHRLVIRVGTLEATASADTTGGPAALKVNFDGVFADPINGRVDSFQWDFDGDGIFDYFSETTPKTLYTYQKAGTYTAVFKVTDGPHSATDQLTITVTKAPPAITAAAATPATGAAPLAVAFTATATDPDGTVVLYQWDFDGDAIADWSSTTTANVQHTYAASGSFPATLTVLDDDGQQASRTVTVTVSQTPPVAVAGAAPDHGHAPLAVHFSAAGSSAPGSTITAYDWDYGDCAILFRDDLEGGGTNWTTTGTWALTTSQSASQTHSLTDSPAGNYTTYSDSAATLAQALDLSAVTAAKLSFRHRLTLGTYYSTASVEVSTDGGTVWTALRSYTASQGSWQLETVDLGQHLTASVLIRFRLVSGYYYVADGWYIDDVQISSCQPGWTASADGEADHTYTAAGDYTATLRVTNGRGDTATTTAAIAVLPDVLPSVSLAASPATGTAPLAVTLTPAISATGATVTSFAWNFGEEYLWLADTGTDTVRRLQGGTMAALAQAGSLLDVTGMAVDPADGTLWLTDQNSDKVVHLAANGTRLSEFGGVGNPVAIAIDTGDDTLWIADSSARQVVQVRPDGIILKKISGFTSPDGLIADGAAGTIWVSDSSGDKVVRLNRTIPDGYDITLFAGSHLTVTGFNYPRGMSLDPSDSSIWVADYYNNQAVHLGADGSVLARISGFSSPRATAVVGSHVWIANYSTSVIRLDGATPDAYDVSTGSGHHLTVAAFSAPADLAVNPVDNSLYVLDQTNRSVSLLGEDGTLLSQTGGFSNPTRLAFATSGTANRLAAADGNAVQHTFTAPGIYPVTFTVTDVNGRTAGDTVTVRVDGAPAVTLAAAPDAGPAPLDVFLRATGTDLDGTVAGYQWDLTDDGAFDATGSSLSFLRHAYPAGIHTARVRVTDSDGRTAEATATVSVGQSTPTAVAKAAPEHGGAPLAVDFSATGADADGTVASYQWDFDDDGAFDATGATASHTYANPGSYTARLRVTDNDGNSVEATATVTVTAGGSPTAVLDISTTDTSNDTPVQICAGGLDSDGTVAEAALDFEGDGTFDQTAALPFAPFADNMETDSGLWTAPSPWTRSSEDAASGAFSFTDSEGGDYGNSQNVALTSAAIDLTGMNDPKLVFRHRYAFASGDYGYVEISSNNGTSWTNLATFTNGTLSSWARQEISLRMYTGGTVLVRFRLASNASGTADGWHLDDVFIGDCLSHTYATPGSYTPTLRITDNDGKTDTASRSLSVGNATGLARIWTADHYHHQVAVFREDGVQQARIGNFYYPRMVAVDPATGTAWAADTSNNRVVRMAATTQNGYRVGSPAIADNSPSKAGGYLLDTATYGAGQIGNGLVLDGAGDYAVIADHPAFHSSSFTMEAWIYPTAASGLNTIIGKVSQGKDFALALYNGAPTFMTYSGGRRYISAAAAAPLNTWTHIAVTYDNPTNTITLYVNGAQAATGNYRPDTSNTDPLQIGKSNCCNEYFTGTVDDVRFWNRARSGAEIAGAMYTVLAGTETDLAGHWPCESDPATIGAITGFNQPFFIAVAPDSSVWVTDRSNHQVVKLGANGSELLRISGFSSPRNLLVSKADSSVWITNEGQHQVVQLAADGTELLRIGGFYNPIGLSRNDTTGAVWISDYYNNRVVALAADGVRLGQFSGIQNPVGIDVYQADGSVWVASHTGDQVIKLAPGGQELLRLPGVDNPHHLRVDQRDGSVWIADMYGDRLLHLAADGTVIAAITGVDNPLNCAIDHPTGRSATLQPPQVTANATPQTGAAPLSVSFTGSATDDGSVLSYSWDFEGDGVFDHSGASAAVSHTYPAAGIFHPTLRATDDDGLSGHATLTVRVGTLAIRGSVTPVSGSSPLDTSLTGGVISIPAGARILQWEWDFEGDGVFDFQNRLSPTTTHRYGTSGSYTPVLRATDDQGNQALAAAATVTVSNRPPTVSNTSTPATGNAPLTVNLTGSASDADGAISLFQWDYNGDAIFDWASTTSLPTWYTYTQAGTYNTLVRVTDNEGLSAEAAKTVTVSTLQTPPTVLLSADRSRGSAPLAVAFTAQAVDRDGTIASYDWDFDGDGVIDQTTATGSASHTYTLAGPVAASVTVTDNDTLTAAARLLINVTGSGFPTARLQAAPTSGPAPLTTTLDGAGSTDADGTIASYHWTFGEDKLWISNTGNNTVGLYRNPNLLQSRGGWSYPFDTDIVRSDNSVWVADYYHNQVVHLAADNSAELARIGGFYYPYGVAVNQNDATVWVADHYHHQIVHLAADGSESGRYSGFSYPTDVAVDHADDSVWIADHSNNRLIHLNQNGAMLATVTGFNRPLRLAVNPADRSVWVADRDGGRVVRLNRDTPHGYDINAVASIATETLSGAGVPLFGNAASGTGKFNSGLALDGSGDYAQLPASAALDVQSFTVEAWVKPVNINGSPAVFMRGNATGGNEIFFGPVSATRIQAVVNDVTVNFDGAANNLTDGNFHHLALVYDQGTGQVSCYLDGNAYGAVGTVAGPLDFGGSHALIGADYDSFNGTLGNYFNGVIDEVRLWNRPLSGAEIVTGMSGELTGNETGLAAYWRFNAITASGYDLSLTGFNRPVDIDIDHQRGRVWVCEEYGLKIDSLSSADGQRLFSVGGFAKPASLSINHKDGSVWVVDTNLHQALHYAIDGSLISYIGGLSSPSWVEVLPDSPLDTGTTSQTSHAYPAEGTYLASLTVTDNDGNADSDTAVIAVGNMPQSLPTAYPTTGVAPLAVRFAANGMSPTGTIENFQWDFDGNGTFDWSTVISSVTTHTYAVPGIYTATQKVTDNQNRTDSKSITITVLQPGAELTAEIIARPAAGQAPLAVSFTAVARSATSFITGYSWDFDNDGVYEISDNPSASASHTYTTTGFHTARLKVTDGNDSAEATTLIKVKEAGAPTATASATPTSGPVSLDVAFSGSATDDGTITDYAWDFDGDGTFDRHSATTGNTAYTYATPGNYTAVFKVTDNSGKTDQVVLPITATAGLTATIDRDQFDPSAGEQIVINSVLTGGATVSVRITDRSGRPVRSLVSGAARTAGFYQDIWDGKDNDGKTMGSGVYLFLIDYTVGGRTYTYDLTNTVSESPTLLTPTYPSVFSPFSADTNFFRYTINTKSEVTIYISPFAGGALTRARTLQLRTPRRAGSYVQIWDGTNDLGDLVDPFDYVLAVFAWPLPPNAIIVENRPVINDLHITPAALNPAAAPYDDAVATELLFSLSKPADISARVLDEDNFLVKSLSAPGLAAGTNALAWDGTNEAGIKVAPGIYRIKLIATDALGHVSQEANTVLIIFY